MWVGKSWQNVHTSSSNLTSLPLHIHAINCELEFLCGRIIQMKWQEAKDNCFCRYGIGQDLLVPTSVYLIEKILRESLSIMESYFTQRFNCRYSGHAFSEIMPFIFVIVKMNIVLPVSVTDCEAEIVGVLKWNCVSLPTVVGTSSRVVYFMIFRQKNAQKSSFLLEAQAASCGDNKLIYSHSNAKLLRFPSMNSE